MQGRTRRAKLPRRTQAAHRPPSAKQACGRVLGVRTCVRHVRRLVSAHPSERRRPSCTGWLRVVRALPWQLAACLPGSPLHHICRSQVPGCGVDLVGLAQFYRRVRICGEQAPPSVSPPAARAPLRWRPDGQLPPKHAARVRDAVPRSCACCCRRAPCVCAAMQPHPYI